VLVLTTVVLGGFRGLIANALWVRAMELQEEDKFFEMVQLSDWITKLQPRVTTVWIVAAWNMSYNISVKFSRESDRWLWVKRGIELLRDEALVYNPSEVLLYRELAWHFQHKMGHNLDDAHLYYKMAWASAMQPLLGGGRPNFDELIAPPNDEARARARTLRERYKLDPAFMKEVDQEYGPLDWRRPETHAIYWASRGKRMAKTPKDLITLRRVLYQSMQMAFMRGRFVENPFDNRIDFGPNLDIVDKVNATYEQALAEDAEMRDNISRAHKNFLLDAVYFLYVHARLREAEKWLAAVKAKYPADYPPNTTLDSYALGRIGADATETDMNRTSSNLRGILAQACYYYAIGEDDQSKGLELLAANVYNRYQGKIVGGPSSTRVGLPPLANIKQDVLQRALDPEHGFSAALAAQLRRRLGLPAAAPSTNPPPAAVPAPTP
jgi:hypothetical protein